MLQPTQAEELENWLAELATEDNHTCWSIVYNIAGLGPDAVPRLLEVLQDAHTPDTARSYVADALGDIGDVRAIVPLFTFLETNDTNLSISVLGALGNLGGPEPSQLLAVLHDDNQDLRVRAIMLLGRLNVQEAVEPLLAITADPDDGIRRSVVEALGFLGGERGFPAILQAATDEDASVRTEAAMQLGKFRSEEAFHALLLLLQDGDYMVRKWACLALRDMGDRAAQDALIVATQDAHLWVRASATEALERVGDVKAVPALLRLLDDEYPVQIRAILALGETGDAGVFPDLLRVRPALDAVHMGWRVDNAIVRISRRHGLA